MMNIGFAECLAVGLAVVAQTAFCSGKPVALAGGNGDDLAGMTAEVCAPNSIRYERFEDALPPFGDFAKYACIYVGGVPKGTDVPALVAAAEAFAQAGGTFIVAGEKTIAALGKGFAESRTLGKGRIAVFKDRVNALRFHYASHGMPFAVADENGVFVPTAEGRKVNDLAKAYADAILGNPETDATAPRSEWAKEPLGAPGDLKATGRFANQPELVAKAPAWPRHFTFAAKGEAGWIVHDERNWQARQLAAELKYHFDRMSGTECRLVDMTIIQPPGTPIVELRVDPLLEVGAMRIEPGEKRLVLSGRAAGLSHAVTYLLETLGCRYLWPGRTGKIIPKVATLEIPAITLSHVSPFKVREIRVFDPLQDYWRQNLERLKIDPKAYKKVYDEASTDHPGNRNFFVWHGVNDGREQLGGAYAWGHYFGDYYQKYGKDHPDWFALQPTGTREQVLRDRPERPQLCLSNRELAHRCAADHIATFRKNPSIRGLSGSLPDGGYMTECMCESCRRLDPPNGQKVRIHVQAPLWTSFEYVSLTDRALTFCNRIVEEIRRECPGRKLCYDIYSSYTEPPLAVRPDLDLVFISCSGYYSSEKGYRAFRRNVADWCTFGNPLLWRPNGLIGFHGAMPQNFARLIFRDLETFKVNGVFGTDFDCMDSQWAVKGLVYYMLSKAHLNIDRLNYTALLDDYCDKAFGPAAKDMHGYFDALERTLKDGIWQSPEKKVWIKCAESLDLAGLQGYFDRAKAAAAGDAEILARIDFHEEGLRYAAFVKAIALADKAGSPEKRKLQGEYIRFIRSRATRPDLAVCPTHLGSTFYEHALSGADFSE